MISPNSGFFTFSAISFNTEEVLGIPIPEERMFFVIMWRNTMRNH